MAQGDSSKATAQGPGLEPSGNIANKATYFDVYTAGNRLFSTNPPVRFFKECSDVAAE